MVDEVPTRSYSKEKNMKGATMKESSRFIPTTRLAAYDIVNKQGQDMGHVQNFVVDMLFGQIAFAIVSFEGIRGITDKWFAIPWVALQWQQETRRFILDMPEEVLKEAPGMHKDKWIDEINKWHEDKDLEVLDRYYTSHGIESYLGILQQKITKIGSHKPDAKFEISKDVAGEYRFKLVATNGECIAVSEGYNAKAGVLNGIESVKRNAAIAVVEDETA
jgi:uncharacterized protein YegP (UPF0339 family)/sporulation protein YlmC with PRC-barrel domain